MTTTYSIIANDAIIATATKKSKAIAAAQAHRDAEGVETSVVTSAGNVVHVVPAPRKIKMSKPYTRTVVVDADTAELINGKRVAYKRTRVGFALLDASKGEYTIFDLVNGKELDQTVEVRTTREAGRFFADEAPALRVKLQTA